MDPPKPAPNWKKNRRARAKIRAKIKSEEFANKGLADPYTAKKLISRSNKEKNRACIKFKKSIKMFKQNSSVEKSKVLVIEEGRNAARALKKEAIDDFKKAQEKRVVGEVMAGKPPSHAKAAEKELLEKIYK
uniref:Uncharacterized protein n=1 Tax=Tetranychus urticae TaxID=32264 RepID=T1JY12_TETUR